MEKPIINPWGYQDIFDYVNDVDQHGQQDASSFTGQIATGPGTPLLSVDRPNLTALPEENQEKADAEPGYHCPYLYWLNIFPTSTP